MSRKDFLAALNQVPLRDMPWRHIRKDGNIDPYAIMVSEIMLQQTQVSRVIPKFEAFIQQFPTVDNLAEAPLGEVLRMWSGLGYNRRAKFLHQAAQAVALRGIFPEIVDELVQLPGIGVNTAGAVVTYAFNKPTLFIETNVRTVYIHHFFHDRSEVSDLAIREKLEETLDMQNPRLFYWRLMDYGTLLKQELGNLSRKSSSYTKQSIFHGSLRQVRGSVLRALAAGPLTKQQLARRIADDRLEVALEALQIEGLITKKTQHFSLG